MENWFCKRVFVSAVFVNLSAIEKGTMSLVGDGYFAGVVILERKWSYGRLLWQKFPFINYLLLF